MHWWVAESQVPAWPPAMAGQSPLVQQPVVGMHSAEAAHFRMVPHVKSQDVPSHVAVPPAGAEHFMQVGPQKSGDVLATQVSPHFC